MERRAPFGPSPHSVTSLPTPAPGSGPRSTVIMSIDTEPVPRVPAERRVVIDDLGYSDDRIIHVSARFGYMETPNVPRALARLKKQGLKFDIMTTSFFLGRRVIVPDRRSGMPQWQDKLFIALNRNATNATDFFQIPTGRVVELGAQVTV